MLEKLIPALLNSLLCIGYTVFCCYLLVKGFRCDSCEKHKRKQCWHLKLATRIQAACLGVIFVMVVVNELHLQLFYTNNITGSTATYFQYEQYFQECFPHIVSSAFTLLVMAMSCSILLMAQILPKFWKACRLSLWK